MRYKRQTKRNRKN